MKWKHWNNRHWKSMGVQGGTANSCFRRLFFTVQGTFFMVFSCFQAHFWEPKCEWGPSEPFSRNWSRTLLLELYWKTERLSSFPRQLMQGPGQLEPFHAPTMTEPNPARATLATSSRAICRLRCSIAGQSWRGYWRATMSRASLWPWCMCRESAPLPTCRCSIYSQLMQQS